MASQEAAGINKLMVPLGQKHPYTTAIPSKRPIWLVAPRGVKFYHSALKDLI